MNVMTVRHTGLAGLSLLMRGIEPVWLLVAALVSFGLRHNWENMPLSYWWLVLGGAMAYTMMANILQLYRPRALLKLLLNFPRLAAVLLATFMLLVMVLFILKTSNVYSRIWLGTWAVTACVGILALRAMVAGIIHRKMLTGKWALRVGILGTGPKALEVLNLLQAHKENDVVVYGLYGLGDEEVGNDLAKRGLVKGRLKELLAAAKKGKIDEVIVTTDLDHYSQAPKLLAQLHQMPLNVHYCLPLPLFGRAAVSRDGLYGLPLALIFRQPMDAYGVWAKRSLDALVSGALLVALAPFLALVALAVYLESGGPVLFRQKRGGMGGRTFEMLKFRSMKVGAAAVLDAEGKEMQAGKTDARITRVGAWLRKTSVDELPQLWNILRGDMSLVGPRPHAVSHDDYYTNLVDRYTSRHRMRPGLTGWAQLNGWRGETETVDKMQKRVEFDIWYTENWSLWLDVKILFLTPFVVLFQRNAY